MTFEKNRYFLLCKIQDAKGLIKDDPVISKGVKIGRVERVRFQNDAVYIWCELCSPITLFEDATLDVLISGCHPATPHCRLIGEEVKLSINGGSMSFHAISKLTKSFWGKNRIVLNEQQQTVSSLLCTKGEQLSFQREFVEESRGDELKERYELNVVLQEGNNLNMGAIVVARGCSVGCVTEVHVSDGGVVVTASLERQIVFYEGFSVAAARGFLILNQGNERGMVVSKIVHPTRRRKVIVLPGHPNQQPSESKKSSAYLCFGKPIRVVGAICFTVAIVFEKVPSFLAFLVWLILIPFRFLIGLLPAFPTIVIGLVVAGFSLRFDWYWIFGIGVGVALFRFLIEMHMDDVLKGP